MNFDACICNAPLSRFSHTVTASTAFRGCKTSIFLFQTHPKHVDPSCFKLFRREKLITEENFIGLIIKDIWGHSRNGIAPFYD